MYMDSSHCNNTGSANFIADYNAALTGETPASKLNPLLRTTVYGYPVLIYYKEKLEDTEQKFIGVGNLNLDKSCKDSYGLDGKVKDAAGVKHDFGKAQFIDDEFTRDILDRVEVSTSGLVETGETLKIFIGGSCVDGKLLSDGNKTVAVLYNGKAYKVQSIISGTETKYYVVLQNPKTKRETALLSEKGYLRSLNNDSIDWVSCSEYKANSGARGAGGFGDYSIESVASDIELRYPDDGDIEDENYAAFQDAHKDSDISFKEFKNPFYYHVQRMIKWVSSADKDEFVKNLDRHFNRNYLMDYYLTILLLGGVDSLGKNLMVGTWGPENHLYFTTEEALNRESEKYDKFAFSYNIGTELEPNIRILTPTVNKNSGAYEYAKNADGQLLYFSEDSFDRVKKEFRSGYDAFEVTTVPGECIWYPTFYDIDTICGLDNSGQLLYDVDIELGDQLKDGTAIYNTADSNLWNRVKNFLHNQLVERWTTLRDPVIGRFTKENLIDNFYYNRQIAKIPEKYYNKDCLIKYIYEGPNSQKGSGAYLYCIHGSRYEQIKRWYSQRLYYLDTMFGTVFGASASSLRFNYSKYDESFTGDPNYYANYAELAAKEPDKYRYDSETGKLFTTTGSEIAPIKFNFKTYQPAYVGIRWFNGMKFNGSDIIFQRVGRDEVKQISGNVKTSGDAEVFIYGGSNIKEIGDLYEYNVKQVDFINLTKLSKLILGAKGYSCVINKLDLGSNNTYISELSLVNCGALRTIDVSKCINLKTLDMTGSGITSVTLPTSGGALEDISYSSAITSIKLENFTNLSNVNIVSLNNITEFIIKNCPKILGSKELPNPKAWALLQQTNNASSLTTIELTSYGYVEPKLLANGEPFFFPDKYYTYATAPKIKGEIYYRGTIIPNNYTQFADRFPELTITYNNITDASGMFENYKNINLIGEAQVYIGDDIYGNHQYTTVKYWKDESKELQDKWHTSEMYEKYGSSSTYSNDINYYQVNGNTYLRLLSLYDDHDLDLVRAEIKKHLLNFTKFTNVNRMFKNMTILDYLDPDTFNNVDLSEASTDEMFAGCINLRYFETPNDIVKCEKRERYIDADGNIVDPSEIEDFNEKLASGEITKEEYWYDPLNRRESDTETVVTAKGMRNIGNLMFQNCKKLRCYIRKLSDNSRITISSTAFYYPCFNISNDSQPSGVTMERPAIFFEHSDKDLLATTTNSTTTINNVEYSNKVADDSVEPKLYYAMNIYKERVPNYSNKFINFSSDNWLRECYFNVVRFERFKNEDATNKLSYAVISENGVEKKVLVDVINGDDLFNKGETIYDNKFNIKSITIGALRNLKTISALTAPIPEYDCLDTANPRFELENSISTLFAEKNFTSETASSLLPENLKKIYITDTKIIKTGVFTGIKTLSTIGLSEDVLRIEDSAFKDCAGLENILWDNASGDGSTTPTSFNRLESIGNNAFMGCLALRELKLSDSVKTIGDGILSGCSSLKEIVYSNQLKTIPAETFRNCKSLTSVSGFSKNIVLIGANAFNSCESLSLFILQTDPEGNPTGKYKFALASGNTNTESISYFEGLHTIGESAFYNTGLAVNGSIIPSSSQYHTKLEIPATMRYIGDNAFRVDYPTQISENRQVELIWKKNSEGAENYEGLYIGSYAFYNLRMAWSPSGLSEELINDCIYIPKLISNDKASKGGIGTSAFAMQGQGEFTAVFCRDSDEIGDTFVSRAKKIVYNYVGIYDGSNNWRYLLATRNSENIAYVQKLAPDGTSLMIPKSVSVNDVNYDIIQILSGALDRQIVLLEFATDSKLELIERNIFTKDNSSGLSTITGLPENLVIEPDNNFKNTLWYNSQQSDSIVKLGKYIIGCRKTTFENNTLDLSAENANIIYDDAFSGIEVQKVIFSKNITAIYDRAFKGAHIDYSNIDDKFILPSNLTYIGKEAFFGCKFKNITIPKTVQFIGADAFTQNQNVSAEKGTLQYLEFEQGCKFTDFPLKLQTEITATGVNTGVSAANITLNTLFVPTDLGKVVVNSSVFKQASQIRNLILGNFKTDSKFDDNMFDNIKLYITPDGTKTTNDKAEGAVEYKIDNKQIYTYKFFDNMCKQADAERFKDTFLETTDARSYCPCGDTETSQGFNMDLDISGLRVYEDATYIDGTSSRNVRELTAAEILMIIAGFTSKPSKELPKLRLRTAQNTLIQPYIGIYSRARAFLPDVIQ